MRFSPTPSKCNLQLHTRFFADPKKHQSRTTTDRNTAGHILSLSFAAIQLTVAQVLHSIRAHWRPALRFPRLQRLLSVSSGASSREETAFPAHSPKSQKNRYAGTPPATETHTSRTSQHTGSHPHRLNRPPGNQRSQPHGHRCPHSSRTTRIPPLDIPHQPRSRPCTALPEPCHHAARSRSTGRNHRTSCAAHHRRTGNSNHPAANSSRTAESLHDRSRCAIETSH